MTDDKTAYLTGEAMQAAITCLRAAELYAQCCSTETIANQLGLSNGQSLVAQDIGQKIAAFARAPEIAAAKRAARVTGWTPEIIEASRKPWTRGDAGRVVVGVDPGRRDGDERGIIVARIAGDGDYYVLDDYSAQCCVTSCADLILTAYREHEADLVVAVANLAGNHLRDFLWEIDRTVRYKAATMTRGLEARAKPVPGWYALDRVHHAKVLPELEEQMCGLGSGGPAARVSALLAALYELRGG